jgi:hypothetical protein
MFLRLEAAAEERVAAAPVALKVRRPRENRGRRYRVRLAAALEAKAVAADALTPASAQQR